MVDCKFIHRATADACNDIKKRDDDDDLELKDPHPFRRYARLVAIAAVGALLVAAVVVMAMRIEKLQSQKQTFPSNSTSKIEAWLSNANRKNYTITCPCQTHVISWCNVTTFYILTGTAQNATNFSIATSFTNEGGGDYLPYLCNITRTNPEICTDIFSPLLNQRDKSTFISTASAYTEADLLYKEIALRIDTNAYEKSTAYSYLQLSSNQNTTYDYVQRQTRLIRDMQSQFFNKSSSTPQDYWNAAQPTRQKYNTTRSFGMEVSWERYLQVCAPPYCDAEYPISTATRVFRAMAQVGGVFTLIKFALKFLLWPSVMFLLGLPKHIKSPAPSA